MLMQIGGQTALLKACWDLPVFNLVQDTGEVLHHRTLPEMCNELPWMYPFLIMLQLATFKGWVLCLSMCDAKAFGPFLPERYGCCPVSGYGFRILGGDE